jgi:integrase
MKGYKRKRGKDSYEIAICMGRNPATGEYDYHRETVKGTAKKVDGYIATLISDFEEGKGIPDTKQTVAKFFKTWEEKHLNRIKNPISKNIKIWYLNHINKYIIPLIGSLKLGKLNTLQIENMFNKIEAEDTTLKAIYSTLRTALNDAVRWRFISYNPIMAVTPPELREREYTILDAKQALHFLEIAKPSRNYCVYLIALTTGMRIDEILGLRWEDIDFKKHVIKVSQQVIGVGKDIEFGTTKGKRSRKILMIPLLESELKIRAKEQKEEMAKSEYKYAEYDLVFDTYKRNPGRPIASKNISQREFKVLLKRAKLPEMKFHELRHSMATLLIELHIPYEVIAQILGHVDTKLLEKTYSHPTEAIQKEAMEKLSQALTKNPKSREKTSGPKKYIFLSKNKSRLAGDS